MIREGEVLRILPVVRNLGCSELRVGDVLTLLNRIWGLVEVVHFAAVDIDCRRIAGMIQVG